MLKNHPCKCPNDRDAHSRLCGKRSAFDRPGGHVENCVKGQCKCPEDKDKNDRKCGKRSSYSKSNGKSGKCHIDLEDISAPEVKDIEEGALVVNDVKLKVSTKINQIKIQMGTEHMSDIISAKAIASNTSGIGIDIKSIKIMGYTPAAILRLPRKKRMELNKLYLANKTEVTKINNLHKKIKNKDGFYPSYTNLSKIVNMITYLTKRKQDKKMKGGGECPESKVGDPIHPDCDCPLPECGYFGDGCTSAPDHPFGIKVHCCCNEHDCCYRIDRDKKSCNHRDMCDDDFRKCIKKSKDKASWWSQWMIDPIADIYYAGVHIFGGPYYSDQGC